MNTTIPTNRDDLIDSRDVIAALDDPNLDPDVREAFAALADQAYSLEDWNDGVTLIRDDYFTEYAKELAWEIEAITEAHTWPFTCIDWEQAARELQMDYTPVEFDGVTYWAR